jgi:hypothetical protein
VLAILAMLASLRVAPGGSAPPIPDVRAAAGRIQVGTGKQAAPIEPESWNDVLELPPNDVGVTDKPEDRSLVSGC